MTIQYGRRYRLQIGEESSGITIENLRVGFDFEKTIKEKPNEGKFTIYNLNPDNRKRILSGEYQHIRFSLGYNELKLVYQGKIVKSALKRQQMDWVLNLECADGDTDYVKAYSALTLAAGSTDQDVIHKAAESFQETRIGTVDYSRTRPLPRAKVLFGNTRDILNQVARNTDANWSIQDGELVVLPPDRVLDNEGVLINMQTGMIHSPEQTSDGLKLQCLINPSLKVGGLVKVNSIIDPVYNGEYKIVRVKYKGDSHTDEWKNELTVVGGQFQKAEKGKKK